MPDDLLRVINADGRAFNVRVLQPGDKFGMDDCLTHEGETVIEFYDATYEGARFGPRGQFVSRYYVSSLDTDWIRKGTGLDLHGGEPVWKLTAENVTAALEYAKGITT